MEKTDFQKQSLNSVPQFYFYSLLITKTQMFKIQFEHYMSDQKSGLGKAKYLKKLKKTHELAFLWLKTQTNQPTEQPVNPQK